jgi:hypothetical protein
MSLTIANFPAVLIQKSQPERTIRRFRSSWAGGAKSIQVRLCPGIRFADVPNRAAGQEKDPGFPEETGVWKGNAMPAPTLSVKAAEK